MIIEHNVIKARSLYFIVFQILVLVKPHIDDTNRTRRQRTFFPFILRKHILICSDKQFFYHFYAVSFLILCISKTAYPYSQILAVKKLAKMFVFCIQPLLDTIILFMYSYITMPATPGILSSLKIIEIEITRGYSVSPLYILLVFVVCKRPDPLYRICVLYIFHLLCHYFYNWHRFVHFITCHIAVSSYLLYNFSFWHIYLLTVIIRSTFITYKENYCS